VGSKVFIRLFIFFVSLRFKSMYYFLATGYCTISLVLFFYLCCLSCWLLYHHFSSFFLSPLPLLLSLFSLFSDVFFGGIVSFRFYRFLSVACVAYFALSLLPFAIFRLIPILRLADVCAILLLGCF
jgi:hypothetical protein